MNIIKRCALISLAGLSGLAASEATLDGVTLGSHVNGPKITAADLQNKVVLFEYWGVNCPPCLRSISHLSHWQEEYGENLLIIANQCQSADDTQAAAKWAENGGKKFVAVINNGNLQNSNVSGIPHCFLFDHKGTLIYDGSPFDVETKMKAAITASPGALIAGREFTTHIQAAKIIGKTQSWKNTLKKLRKIVAAGPDEEAQFLLDRVAGWAEKELATINKMTSGDPLAAMTALADAITKLKQDELAQDFESLQKKLKKDKVFKKVLKGCQIVAAIKADASRKHVTAKMASKSKKIKGYTKAYIAQLLKVENKYKGTAAATQAAALRATFETHTLNIGCSMQ